MTVTFPALPGRNTNRTTPGRDPAFIAPATRTLTEPASPPRASLEIWLESFDGQAVGATSTLPPNPKAKVLDDKAPLDKRIGPVTVTLSAPVLPSPRAFAENIAVIEDKGSGAHRHPPHRPATSRSTRWPELLRTVGLPPTHHRAGVADSVESLENLGFVIQIKTPRADHHASCVTEPEGI